MNTMKNPELNKTLLNLNLNSTINDIVELVKDFYPGMEVKDILNLPLLKINELINAINEDDCEEDVFPEKHCQTRKKRTKRLCKKYKPHYKKETDKSSKKTRKKVGEDVTNRSYLNKASKSFVPNRKI